MEYYKNKIAIVTGGASGIGRSLCAELGHRGARVIVADINLREAERGAAQIVELGGKAEAAQLDVSQSGEVKAIIDQTIHKYGCLDLLFNNAGIGLAGEVRDMSLPHWQAILDVNLLGVIYGTTIGYQAMIKQGFGQIVNTSSLSGLVPGPMNAAYSTTKHAVVGLSTSLRPEAAGLGIKISVVCPGPIKTNIFNESIGLNIDMKSLITKIPFKMIEPEEAARKILLGIQKNQGIIIFPFYAKLTTWVYRCFPALLIPWFKMKVNKFRSFRNPSNKKTE